MNVQQGVDLSNMAEYEQQVHQLSSEETVDARYVHPKALALFKKAPCLRHIPVFGLATEGFGPKCVTALGMCQFLCKGIANNLISYSLYGMFMQRFGLTSAEYQRMAAVSKMGWAVKPFTAIMSDIFALFSYSKRWYCAASCVIGAGAAVGFALLPSAASSAGAAAGLVFLTGFSKANVDILTEGHYSRLLRRRPDSGPALVTWVWWFIMLGGVVGALVQGPLSDMKKPQIGVFISAAFQLTTTFFFIFNWIEERTNKEDREEDQRIERERLMKEIEQETPVKRLDDSEDVVEGNVAQSNYDEMLGLPHAVEPIPFDDIPSPIYPCLCGAVEVNVDVARRNYFILIYTVAVTLSTVSMTVITILGTKQDRLIACVVISTVMMSSGFLALPLLIAKTNLYVFLQMLLYIQLPGALDSFYLADAKCIADGPHFNQFFYFTVGSAIGNIAGIVGTTLFAYIFSKRSYRLTFIITTLIQILGSIFDIIIVKRWNKKIGINDHVMYILGDGIVYNVCFMISWMPCVLLISRVCPKGTESVIYALIAGCGNFGQAMSNTVGSTLMEYRFPVISKPPCDFSNVPMLLLIGHFIIPLAIIPLTFLLIPAVRVCDDIDVNGKLKKPKETANENPDDNIAKNAREPNARGERN